MPDVCQIPISSRPAALLAGLLLLATAACGDKPTRYTISDVRDGAAAPAKADPHAGLFDGHDLAGAAHGMSGHPMSGHGLSGPGAAGASHWEWDAPRTWRTIAPKPSTEATFTVADDPRAFVTLTVLAGDGAPREDVNRWRGQMGLPPVDALEDTPDAGIELLGGTGRFVRIDGSFTGMGQGTALAGARLLGVIRDHPEGRVCLEMIGPRDTVAAEEAAFRAWAGSLRHTTLPSVPTSPTPAEQKVTWTPPSGWRLQPPRPMREVTYRPTADSQVECYVTILGAGAADVAANLGIWRGQMGKPALGAEEIAALPRIRVLGRDVALFQAEGAFHGPGRGPIADAAMLGVACPRGDHAVFVKMIGPRAAVLALRPQFEAFCRSLRSAP